MRIRCLVASVVLVVMLPGRPGAAPADAEARRAHLEEFVLMAGTVKRFDGLLRSVAQQCKTTGAGAADPVPARFCEAVVAQFGEHDLKASVMAVLDSVLAGTELEQELSYLKSPSVATLAKVQLPLRKATGPIERDWLKQASQLATETQAKDVAALPKAPQRPPWMDDVLLATVGVDREGLRHRLIESARRLIEAPADRWSSKAMTDAAEMAARRYEDAVEATLAAEGAQIAKDFDVVARRRHDERTARINDALQEMWATTRPAIDAHVAAKRTELRAMTPEQRLAAYPE